MILRIQTNDGMKRIEVAATDTVKSLYEKITQSFNLHPNGWLLCKDRALKNELKKNTRSTLKTLKFSHGDVVYMKNYDGEIASSNRSEISTPDPSTGEETELVQASTVNVVEDEIDVILSNESGLIHREKNPQLCRHGRLGKCLHCAPLEPYDEDYLKTLNPPAKHLSFHAYLKKLKSGASRGKFVSLEDVNCKIKPGCTEHLPWPKGICTRCQPSAVMLNRQTYRHVDNIMFENPVIMDRFLNYWRTTGCQRLGYLYGKYEKHENVPLGLRATVAAIYEPPQDSSRDKIQLKDDPFEEIVELLASNLGLRKVGWIITDLIPDENISGQVKYLRHAETHFLTAQECIMAADFQNKYPNHCRDSSKGKFGSKFVTVVVSGHEDKHIHYDGWQVSNQCMALVRDECLVPTLDDPALGYIKESSSEQYVPDVFYKEKDEYKNEVTKDSRPMPMEYFLIEVPAAFPLEPVNTFIGVSSNPFPIENRVQIGETQNFEVFMKYVTKITSGDANVMNGFLDFHFLIYLMTNEMISLKHKMSELCKALISRDAAQFHHWLESDEWKTIEQMIHAHAPSPPPTGGAGGGFPRSSSSSSVEYMETDNVDVTRWTCRHCTFINYLDTCEMCNLPKD